MLDCQPERPVRVGEPDPVEGCTRRGQGTANGQRPSPDVERRQLLGLEQALGQRGQQIAESARVACVVPDREVRARRMIARGLTQRELEGKAGGHLRAASRALCLANQVPAQLGEAEGDAEGNEAALPGEVPKPLFDPGPIGQDGDPRAAPARLGQGELRGHPPPLTRGG